MENHAKYPDDLEARLDGLFARYRESLPDVDASPNFMPELWQKIDASQSFFVVFRRWTRGLATASATLCLLMVLYLFSPGLQLSPVYTATYLDALAADHASPERLAYAEVGYPDLETGPRQ